MGAGDFCDSLGDGWGGCARPPVPCRGGGSRGATSARVAAYSRARARVAALWRGSIGGVGAKAKRELKSQTVQVALYSAHTTECYIVWQEKKKKNLKSLLLDRFETHEIYREIGACSSGISWGKMWQDNGTHWPHFMGEAHNRVCGSQPDTVHPIPNDLPATSNSSDGKRGRMHGHKDWEVAVRRCCTPFTHLVPHAPSNITWFKGYHCNKLRYRSCK